MLSEKWKYRLLGWSLAFVWIWTGVVTLFLYPMGDSLALLERVGIPAGAGLWLTQGVAALEIGMGVLMVSGRWIRPLAAIQIGLMVGFTLIVTLFLPEFWLHPFGPISKNVALIGATIVLYFEEGS